MPASTHADPISSTLKRSFGGGSSKVHLEEGLETALAKRSLLPVAFDPPCRMASSPGPLKHYILLNGSANNGKDSSSCQVQQLNGASVPRPKITFFRQSDVTVGYRSQFPPGAGMMNVGNTCYLNSTLQALFHTPALLNYLSDGHHKCIQANGGGYSLHACTICALGLTLKESHRSHIVRPSRVYEKLKTICKHLVHGRQEDAHEFLRYLIESLQKSFLNSVKAAKTLDNPSKETTPFNQIFGGYMRQDVTCVRCKYVSTTFQHFMDLLLDIRYASNIEEALSHYFRPEKLGGNDGSNMYKCEKCKVKVPAQKSSFIERPPVVLCVQLKRFALTGGKISKSVQLSRKLEVSRFVRGGRAPQQKLEYRLVSMITHVGPSPNCGHYTAIGEASNGQFYQFDDSHVRPVPVSQALNTASYVVMYEMTPASHNAWTKSSGNPPPPVTTSTVIKKPEPTPPAPPKMIKPVVNNGTNIGPLKKKLVPYEEELDSSSTEEDEKPCTTTTTKEEVPAPSSSNGIHAKREGDKPSGCFLPLSVALKQQQVQPSSSSTSQQDDKRPSASGTWTVVDMEHHNPSIHSDNSSGSGSTWKIHSVKCPSSSSAADNSVGDNKSWSVKNNNSATAAGGSEGSEAGSPKKAKKMSVKEALSNTFGRLFPSRQAKATVVSNGVSHHSSEGPPSNGNMSNGHHPPEIRNGENEEGDDESQRFKKRKKSFSNGGGGIEESPSKKHSPTEQPRWNNGGGVVVDELLRQSSLSEKVTSWNGIKSSTFSSSNSPYHRSKSDSRDRYDEELDRGRAKKIKRRHSDVMNNSSSSSSSNPFQMAQQNGYHRGSPSFNDSYNGRRRPFYHHRNSGGFEDRKGGYRNYYKNNNHHHRSRR